MPRDRQFEKETALGFCTRLLNLISKALELRVAREQKAIREFQQVAQEWQAFKREHGHEFPRAQAADRRATHLVPR